MNAKKAKLLRKLAKQISDVPDVSADKRLPKRLLMRRKDLTSQKIPDLNGGTMTLRTHLGGAINHPQCERSVYLKLKEESKP
jgi:hypothetical protein